MDKTEIEWTTANNNFWFLVDEVGLNPDITAGDITDAALAEITEPLRRQGIVRGPDEAVDLWRYLKDKVKGVDPATMIVELCGFQRPAENQ